MEIKPRKNTSKSFFLLGVTPVEFLPSFLTGMSVSSHNSEPSSSVDDDASDVRRAVNLTEIREALHILIKAAASGDLNPEQLLQAVRPDSPATSAPSGTERDEQSSASHSFTSRPTIPRGNGVASDANARRPMDAESTLDSLLDSVDFSDLDDPTSPSLEATINAVRHVFPKELPSWARSFPPVPNTPEGMRIAFANARDVFHAAQLILRAVDHVLDYDNSESAVLALRATVLSLFRTVMTQRDFIASASLIDADLARQVIGGSGALFLLPEHAERHNLYASARLTSTQLKTAEAQLAAINKGRPRQYGF